jgi:hypothetical protein
MDLVAPVTSQRSRARAGARSARRTHGGAERSRSGLIHPLFDRLGGVRIARYGRGVSTWAVEGNRSAERVGRQWF